MQLLTNVLMSNSDLQQNILCIFWIHTLHRPTHVDYTSHEPTNNLFLFISFSSSEHGHW